MADPMQDLIKYAFEDGVNMTRDFEGNGKQGRPFYAYDDSKGKRTVGYGSLVTDANRSILGEDVISGKTPIEPGLAGQLMTSDYRGAIEDAIKYAGSDNWARMSANQQMRLADMSYNLGLTKLSDFTDMRKGLDADDDAKVKEEMEDSDWFGQVGDRSKEHQAEWGA